MTDLGDRGTGRTTRQLEALPDGSIYVVAFTPEISHCRHLLAQMGRKSDAIRFVTLDQVPHALMGHLRSTVLDVDHFVYEVANAKQRELLRMFRVQYTLPPVPKRTAA